MNEKPDPRFVTECPCCQATIVLQLPDTGHKVCPVCSKPFNVVNGKGERMLKLVDMRVEYLTGQR